MANKFLEILLGTLTGTLETIGESKLVDVLQQLHDKDENLYKGALHGFYAGVVALKPIVDKTKTTIDDGILGAIEEAVLESAKNNGVEL